MSDAKFEQWKTKLWSLDRYGTLEDSDEFEKLVKESDIHDRRVLVELLKTFNNDHDEGVQHSVEHVLDTFDHNMFAECLVKQFPDMQSRSSEQEWPLLLIGRYVNSHNSVRLRLFVEYSEKDNNKDDPLSMYNFMRSDYFLDEYPEMLPYLNHENDKF
jgi:hypothetical protein